MSDHWTDNTRRWLLWGVAIAALVGGAWAMLNPWYGGRLEASVTWPDRLRWSSETELLVAVTDRDGDPVEDASIEVDVLPESAASGRDPTTNVLEGQFQLLTSGATNERGRAWLQLPPVEMWFPENEMPTGGPTVVVRVRDGWTRSLHGASYPPPRQASVSLTADRHRYRPGQTVHLRGRIQQTDGSGSAGAGASDADESPRLRVEEPGGNAIVDRPLEVGEAGLVDASFELASMSSRGTYRALLSFRDGRAGRTFQVLRDGSATGTPGASTGDDVTSDSAATRRARTFTSPLPSGGTVSISSASDAVAPGRDVSFGLTFPERTAESAAAIPVVAVHDGVVVARTRVERSNSGHRSEGTLALPVGLGGSASLVALDSKGRPIGRTDVEIGASSGSSFELDLPEGPFRGGEEIAVDLNASFDGVADGDDVVYSVSAVSAREQPDAKGRTPETPDSRGPVVHPAMNQTAAQYVRAGWIDGWTALLFVLALGLAIGAVTVTYRRCSFESLGWGRVLLVVALAAGAVAAQLAILAATSELQTWVTWLFPGVAGLLVVLGFVQTTFRGPAVGVRRWLALVALQIALAVLWIGSMAAAGKSLASIPRLRLAAGILVAAVALESIFWAGRTLEAKLNWAFLATAATLAGTVIAPALALTGFDGGRGRAPSDLSPQPASEPVHHAAQTPPSGGSAPDAPEQTPEAPMVGETLLWRPAVEADDAGSTRIEWTLPDDPGRWQFAASAHGPGGETLDREVTLAVESPFSVELAAPQALRRGDRAKIPMTVADRRESAEQPLEIRVAASAEGAIAIWQSVGDATIPSGGKKRIYVPVAANDAGSGKLEIRVVHQSTGENSTTTRRVIRRELEVDARGQSVEQTRSGRIGEGWRETFEIPDAAYSESLVGRVELLGGPISLRDDGLDPRFRRPLDTAGGAAARLRSNLDAIRHLDAVGRPDWPARTAAWSDLREDAVAALRDGLQRLVVFQRTDGGFARYADPDSTADTGTTALAVRTLADVRQHTDTVDPEPALVGALDWLRRRSRNRPCPTNAESNGSGRLADIAYRLWALEAVRDVDEPVDEAIRRDEKCLKAAVADASSMQPATRAVAANALEATGARKSAEQLLEPFVASATSSGDGEKASKTADRSYAYRVSTTALAARALIELEKHPEAARALGRKLAARRQPSGGWAPPRATARAIEALNRLHETRSDAGEQAEPVGIKLLLDRRPLPAAGREGIVHFTPGRDTRRVFETTEISPDSARFDFWPTRTSTWTIAQATVRYRVPWRLGTRAGRTQLPTPVEVETEVPEPEVAVSEPLSMTVTLQNATDQRRREVVVELPAVPGASVGDDAIRAAGNDRAIWVIGRTPTHVITRIGAVEPNGDVRLDYAPQTGMPGRFRLPPTRVYDANAPLRADTDRGARIDVADDSAE